MASSSAPVHPARYLTLFLVLLIGVYLLVFLTGDKQAKPKLGIDLQGGTRVTLTARTPDGSAPTREALNQAQQIISARVNGLGVSGSEVIIDGSNLVITVPGNDSSEARNLGQTARLYIRPVIHVIPAQGQGQQPPSGAPPGAPPAAPGCHRAHRLQRRACHRAHCRGARAWDRSGRARRARVTAVARRTGTATGGSGTTAAAVSAGAAGHARTDRTRAGGAADTGTAAAHTGSSACAGRPAAA